MPLVIVTWWSPVESGGLLVLGTSTRLVPSRIVSSCVVMCRLVFGMSCLNWPNTNPAYAPPSAHPLEM